MTTDPQSLNPANGRAAAIGPRRSRGWIWFFVMLVVLTVLATAVLWFYNAQQQLTPEQLAAARERWEEKRPPNYKLTWIKEGSAAGMIFDDSFEVTVRRGEVRSVLMRQQVRENGRLKPVERKLETRFYQRYDMDGLFKDLKEFLKIKADPSRRGRVYLTARFDPVDGHLEGYIYSNPENNQRIKVTVQLEPLSPQTDGKPAH